MGLSKGVKFDAAGQIEGQIDRSPDLNMCNDLRHTGNSLISLLTTVFESFPEYTFGIGKCQSWKIIRSTAIGSQTGSSPVTRLSKRQDANALTRVMMTRRMTTSG